MILLRLFWAFFKIGTFAFGGGYAVIALLRDEAVNNGWATAAEFADFVAISQITPGPIAVNMATFVGFRVSGVVGALIATLGVVLPSFCMILVIMRFLKGFRQSKIVDGVFYGLRPATVGMIIAAALAMAQPEILPNNRVEWRSLAVFAAAYLAIWKFKANLFYVIAGAALAGLVLWWVI